MKMQAKKFLLGVSSLAVLAGGGASSALGASRRQPLTATVTVAM